MLLSFEKARGLEPVREGCEELEVLRACLTTRKHPDLVHAAHPGEALLRSPGGIDIPHPARAQVGVDEEREFLVRQVGLPRRLRDRARVVDAGRDQLAAKNGDARQSKPA